MSTPLFTLFLKTFWFRLRKHYHVSPRHSFSLRLPLFGVTLGVSGFLIVISIMSGFVKNLHQRLLRFEPHLILQLSGVSIDSLKPFFHHPFVRLTVPFFEGEAFIITADQARSVQVIGMQTVFLKRLKLISPPILEHYSLQSDAAPVFMGFDLAQQLNIHTDDSFQIIPLQDNSLFSLTDPLQYPVYLAKTFYARNQNMDQRWVILSEHHFRELFSLDFQTPHPKVWFQLHDPYKVDILVRQIQAHTGLSSSAFSTWSQRNKTLLKALQLERWAVLLILGLVVIVGCLSITITLILFLKKRRKEMAVLLSLGLSQTQLQTLYLAVGCAISFLGIILGVCVASSVLWFLRDSRSPHILDRLSEYIFHVSLPHFPVFVQAQDWGLCLLLTMVCSVFAAYWPTRIVRSVRVTDVLSKRVL